MDNPMGGGETPGAKDLQTALPRRGAAAGTRDHYFSWEKSTISTGSFSIAN